MNPEIGTMLVAIIRVGRNEGLIHLLDGRSDVADHGIKMSAPPAIVDAENDWWVYPR